MPTETLGSLMERPEIEHLESHNPEAMAKLGATAFELLADFPSAPDDISGLDNVYSGYVTQLAAQKSDMTKTDD